MKERDTMTAASFAAESGGERDCVDSKGGKCFVGKMKQTFTSWQFFLFLTFVVGSLAAHYVIMVRMKLWREEGVSCIPQMTWWL